MIQDFRQIFRASTPVRDSSLFFGRSREKEKLLEIISRPGHHPIIFGERGIGKTSLVKLTFLPQLVPRKLIWVTANRKTTFDRFAKAVLRKLGLMETITERTSHTQRDVKGEGGVLGFKAGASRSEKEGLKLSSPMLLEVGPWELFERLDQYKDEILIIIDELENARNANTDLPSLLVDFIKTISDNQCLCDPRVAVIGVSKDVHTLLEEHDSIRRSLSEVELPRLTNKHLLKFLKEAESRIDYSIPPIILKLIADDSLGFPYYANLITLEMLSYAEAINEKFISLDSFSKGTKIALERAFHGELLQYSNITSSISYEESLVLRQMVALSPKSRIPIYILDYKLVDIRGIPQRLILEAIQDLIEKDILLLQDGMLQFREPLASPFLRRLFFPPDDAIETT